MRKFEIVKTENLVDNVVPAKMPQRATKFSAGYDMYSPFDYELKSGETKLLWTNIKAQMNDDEYLMLCVTSGMGKKGIKLANGVGIVDADYYSNPKNDGNLGFLLQNLSSLDYIIKAGDKIGQGIFMKYLVVDNEAEISNERVGGFGSTVKN